MDLRKKRGIGQSLPAQSEVKQTLQISIFQAQSSFSSMPLLIPSAISPNIIPDKEQFQSKACECDENSNNDEYRLIYFASMTHFSNISLNSQASYIVFSAGELIHIKNYLRGVFYLINFPNCFQFGIIFSWSCMPMVLHNQDSKILVYSQTHRYNRKLLGATFLIHLEPSDLKNRWCISKLKLSLAHIKSIQTTVLGQIRQPTDLDAYRTQSKHMVILPMNTFLSNKLENFPPTHL